jgi:hypothetical protein
VSKRRRLPKFTAVSSAVVWKDGVDVSKLPPGKPHPVSIVDTLLDEHGKRWRSYDGDEPVRLDTDTIVPRR